MSSLPNDEYLTTAVMTASPQKLQLMVLDLALRSALQAKLHLEARQFGLATTANLRAQKAVSQLLAGLNYETKSPLIGRIAGIYLFVYKSLIAGQLNRSVEKVADAIRILELDRDTWRQICERLPPQTTAADAMPVPVPALLRHDDSDVSDRVSFEA